MADFFQVTEEQVSLFEPLMPDIYKVLLKSDPGLIMVGAAEGEMACGVLVCRDYDNTISILYMAVSEEYRGHGLATGMVEFLCSAALRAEHAVYCDFVTASPYEDPVYGVLNATGMFSLDRLPGGRYEGYISELANAVRLSDNIVMNTDFLSFDQAKTNERNQLRLILRENDCDYIEEDRGQYLYDLSYIAFSKARHQPIAAIMVAKGPE